MFEQDKSRIIENADNKKLNIVTATEDDFMNQIEKADSIYIRGGETDKLINTLKQYPDFKEVIKNKIISGSSAGAYVLSTYYASASKGGIHKGLGILPLRVICHYQSEIHKIDESKKHEDPVALIEEYPKDLELIVLKDYEWKSFELK